MIDATVAGPPVLLSGPPKGLPARKLAIAISVTVNETADPDRNYSSDILKDLAAEFVSESPL